MNGVIPGSPWPRGVANAGVKTEGLVGGTTEGTKRNKRSERRRRTMIGRMVIQERHEAGSLPLVLCRRQCRWMAMPPRLTL